MNQVLIVIPTLDPQRGLRTGYLAKLSAGCDSTLVRVVVIHDKDKDGFTKTVNRGLRKRANGEDVCILNDDIDAFQFGWLRILWNLLYSQPDFGLIGPSGRSASTPKGGRLGDSGLKSLQHLPFWCVLIREAVFYHIGILDERFIHYSSDTWFCRLAIRAKWKCVWAKSVFLWHHHQGSGFQKEWRVKDRAMLVRAGRELGVAYSPKIPDHRR